MAVAPRHRRRGSGGPPTGICSTRSPLVPQVSKCSASCTPLCGGYARSLELEIRPARSDGRSWLQPATTRRVTAFVIGIARPPSSWAERLARRTTRRTALTACQARFAAFAFARLAVMAGMGLFAHAGWRRLCSDALRSCCRSASLVADRSLLMVSSVLLG